MGLRRIEEKLLREAEMKKKGAEMAIKSLEVMSQQVRTLHKDLQNLEKKYETDFKKNPALTQQLMNLREELGLPRAIGIYDIGEKPSFIQRLKGKDEYLNFLALRILEIAKNERNRSGGLLSTTEIVLKLNDESQGIAVAIADVSEALNLLQSNGLVHNIRELAGMQIVEFIDPNLSQDHNSILELAARYNGQISLTDLVKETQWSIERVNQALSSLIQKKLVLRSETLDGITLSFPGV
jgi:regulator of replication initiation timing